MKGGLGLAENLFCGGTIESSSDRRLKDDIQNIEDSVNKVQQLIAEELSPSEELQEAIKLVERIDSKISGINGETEVKDDNKNRIQIIQVVPDKDRIKFCSLAREVIQSEEDLEREDENKTSAVHFLRWELSKNQIQDFKNGNVLSIGVTHPEYNASHIIQDTVRLELVKDFF